MSQLAERVLEDMEQLYVAQQRLNRALISADTKAINTVGQEVSQLVMRIEKVNPETLPPSELDRLRVVARRIRTFQQINQTLCDGALRTLRVCIDFLGREKNYSAEGKLAAATSSSGLNVSV
jgi:hypothetical protein